MADTTKPNPPTVTATLNRATVKWSGASDNTGIDHYEVWDGPTYLQTLASTTRTCTTPILAPGVHPLRVVAYDAAGNYANSVPVDVTVGGATAPTEPPPTSAYRFNTLVFEENFDALDLTRWSLYNGTGHAGNGLRDPKCWAVGPAEGANGNALIGTAFWDASVGKLRAPGMSHRQGFLYGRFEVRMRTEIDPSGVTASNFLTWPDDGVWPAHGENNIWETTGTGNATRYPMKSYIHYGADNQQKYFSHPVSGAEWHTVAMEWSADRIDIWRDGVLVWSMTDKAAIPTWSHHVCLQLDGLSNRDPGKAIRVFYDHVRIYR